MFFTIDAWIVLGGELPVLLIYYGWGEPKKGWESTIGTLP